MATDAARPARLRSALVRRVHGVRGEVRAESLGGDWRRFAPGTRLAVEADGRQLTVRSARDGGDGSVLLAFDEVGDAEAARTLRGQYLDVAAGSARELSADEWFTWQLIGLRARSPSGEDLGTVVEVEAAVSSDVLVIRSPAGVRRYPMVREFVRGVDVGAGEITVEPRDEVGT